MKSWKGYSGRKEKVMKKHLANIVTLSRILGAPFLFLLEPFSPAFLLLYAGLCLTDVIDGFVARTLHIESDLGRKLDSISDLTLYSIVLIIVAKRLGQVLPYGWLIAINVVLGFRLLYYLYYLIRFHHFVSNHLILNKICSAMFLLLPFALTQSWGDLYCMALVSVGYMAAGYEAFVYDRKHPLKEKDA